jgi:hypothetical protein
MKRWRQELSCDSLTVSMLSSEQTVRVYRRHEKHSKRFTAQCSHSTSGHHHLTISLLCDTLHSLFFVIYMSKYQKENFKDIKMDGPKPIFLFLCSVPSNSDLGGIRGSLRYIEETVEKETLWLYQFFGSTKDVVASEDCDDPIKIQCCPSALIPHYPTSNNNVLHLCLEEPDDPECQKLHRELINDLPGPSSFDRDPAPVSAPHTIGMNVPISGLGRTPEPP